MDVLGVEQLREELLEFASDVFASLTRAGWRERGESYLRGLMIDGKRKSIQPMASRLPDVHEQALNHFVTNSPWDPQPVRQRLAVKMTHAIGPAAWVFDDTGHEKSGDASPCVARQYTGTAGKVTNAQVAVSLHLATDAASCPVNWRLFVPEQWDPESDRAPVDVAVRRERAAIPDTARHTEKWRLALDMLDEAIGWGLTPPLVAADAGYGDVAEFRQGLEDRGLRYMMQIASNASARPQAAQRSALPDRGQGRPSVAKYRDKASSVKALALATGQAAAQPISWRQGSKHRGGHLLPMRSHFLFLRVRPASRVHQRAHPGEDVPVRWLIVEWPPTEPEPTRYWLSNLPATTPLTRLARLAKLRWRIEHDYRELKDGLGLDHYEGRTWQGWHHHVTLVSAAHAFCTLQRLNPKAHAPA